MVTTPSFAFPGPGKVYDVVIVGGGPAGLTAAQFAARAKLSTVVLDRSPAAGALGLTQKIENYPGVPGVRTGLELLEIFRKQAIDFGAEYVQTQVLEADVAGEVKTVVAANGTYQGRTLIVATGSMGRKPVIPGEAEFLGRGVSYCATCDAAFFGDAVVAVAGDTDEAVEEALLVAKYARTVYVLAPGPRLRADPEAEDALRRDPRIELLTGHRLLQIRGERDGAGVTGVVVRDREGKQVELAVSGVFIYLQGVQPVVDFLKGAVELTETGCVKVDREMRTSVPGVYAVGDVTCKEIRQAVIAAAEGCVAALAADKYLHGRTAARSLW
ncbi:MAG TPA: FAD-dependent oxidoreductase [Dehalococcoidia bacterium]|nr:FAD-dependent oxidoreductase [Dehalococcoidia bacterium]